MHSELILTHKMLGHLAIVGTSAGIFTEIDFSHTITLGGKLQIFRLT